MSDYASERPNADWLAGRRSSGILSLAAPSVGAGEDGTRRGTTTTKPRRGRGCVRALAPARVGAHVALRVQPAGRRRTSAAAPSSSRPGAARMAEDLAHRRRRGRDGRRAHAGRHRAVRPAVGRPPATCCTSGVESPRRTASAGGVGTATSATKSYVRRAAGPAPHVRSRVADRPAGPARAAPRPHRAVRPHAPAAARHERVAQPPLRRGAAALAAVAPRRARRPPHPQGLHLPAGRDRGLRPAGLRAGFAHARPAARPSCPPSWDGYGFRVEDERHRGPLRRRPGASRSPGGPAPWSSPTPAGTTAGAGRSTRSAS